MPDQPAPDAPDVTPAEPDQVDAVTPAEETDAPEPADVEETEVVDEAAEETPDETPEDETFADVDLDTLTPENVRERYQQMQAAFTQKTQALAEQRRELEGTVAFVDALVAADPDEDQAAAQEAAFRALGERLGYTIEDGDEEAETDDGDQPESDEPEFRDPRVDELLAEREAEAAAKAEAEFEAALDAEEERIESELKVLAKVDGIESLSDDEMDTLFDVVLSLPPVDGGPDIKGAYERVRKAVNADRERWVQSKQADAAPSGTAGEEKPDLSTVEGRVAHAARAAAAAMRA